MLFLIYVNDLSNHITSKCKLFANDTSLLSVIHDIDTTANYFNHKLEEICEWSFQQKISFNQDPSKQAQELIFSKKKNCFYPPNCLF